MKTKGRYENYYPSGKTHHHYEGRASRHSSRCSPCLQKGGHGRVGMCSDCMTAFTTLEGMATESNFILDCHSTLNSLVRRRAVDLTCLGTVLTSLHRLTRHEHQIKFALGLPQNNPEELSTCLGPRSQYNKGQCDSL